MPVVTTYTATSNFTLNTVASPPPAGNDLATAAAALIPGSGATSYASFSPTGLNLMAQTAILNWCARGHWDPINLRWMIVCKAAESTTTGLEPHNLFQFDAAANTVTLPFSSRTLPTGSGTGHGYDSACMDPATGDLYFVPYDGDYVIRWTGSDWVKATGAVTNSGGAESGGPFGFSWHPNLYGTGDGGIVEIRNSNARAWRKSAGASSNFAAIGTLPYSNIQYSQGVYCSALDATVASAGTAGLACFRVDGGTTPVASRMPFDLPIRCSSSSGDANLSRLFPTPSGSVAIFESADAARVWRLNTATLQWELQTYTHPLRFAANTTSPSSWPTIFVSTYGVYWAVRESNSGNSTPNSLLWRCPASL